MLLSIPIETMLQSDDDTNVTCTCEVFSNTMQTFLKDSQYRDGRFYYRFVKDDYTIPEFELGMEGDYNTGDVIFKDGVSQVVTKGDGTTTLPKRPELYAAVETGFDATAWTERYLKVAYDQTVDGFIKEVTDDNGRKVTYKIVQDESSSTGWTWTTTWSVQSKTWTYYRYDASNKAVYKSYEGGQLYLTWDNVSKISISSGYGAEPADYTIVTSSVDGKRYLIGTKKAQTGTCDSGCVIEYEVAQEVITYTLVTKKTSINIVDYPITNEAMAVIEDAADPKYRWYARYAVSREGYFYIRTSVDLEQETETLPNNVYTPVSSIEQIDGFTNMGYVDPYKPFDNKAYTYVEQAGDITYTLYNDSGRMDTVAIGGVICDTIDMDFYDAAGTLVFSIADYNVNNTRDADGILPNYQTTVILYSTDDIIDIGGRVEITFRSTGVTRIGTILLGLSVCAGFTNLVFSNDFKDYSPYEKDQWGNIMYVPGVKVRNHYGTVDIELNGYDMINRLILSIGGSTVILNGSDSKRNLPADGTDIFASTMLIGRMSDYKLQTKMDKHVLSKMATYSFKLTEDV